MSSLFLFAPQSLNRVCQDSETREVLERVSKQVVVLQQSAGRVASSSEQFGFSRYVQNVPCSLGMFRMFLVH